MALSGNGSNKADLRREAFAVLRRNTVNLFQGARDYLPFAWTPEKGCENYMIQVSGKRNGPDGRHFFGIAVERFPTTKYFALYAAGENRALRIPMADLKAIFERFGGEAGGRLKVEKGQWHVNVLFDRYGTQLLHPVGVNGWVNEKIDVSRYAIPVAGSMN